MSCFDDAKTWFFVLVGMWAVVSWVIRAARKAAAQRNLEQEHQRQARDPERSRIFDEASEPSAEPAESIDLDFLRQTFEKLGVELPGHLQAQLDAQTPSYPWEEEDHEDKYEDDDEAEGEAVWEEDDTTEQAQPQIERRDAYALSREELVGGLDLTPDLLRDSIILQNVLAPRRHR